jgi:hypothetical protein
MSDRNVFVAAFLTSVLIMGGAFVLSELFFFEFAKSTIFVAIAVLAFYGESEYSYMLGIIAPVLWFVVDILTGTFINDFRVLFSYVTGNTVAPLETPLHGLARIVAVVLVAASVHAWRKEVPEKFFGKTFWISTGISLTYAVALGVWYLRLFGGTG